MLIFNIQTFIFKIQIFVNMHPHNRYLYNSLINLRSNNKKQMFEAKNLPTNVHKWTNIHQINVLTFFHALLSDDTLVEYNSNKNYLPNQ